jgi:hypothetical protein
MIILEKRQNIAIISKKRQITVLHRSIQMKANRVEERIWVRRTKEYILHVALFRFQAGEQSYEML